MYVHSTSRKPFSFQWDGVSFTLEPGDTLEIPDGAARHIFGYENPDLTSILISLGFVHNSADVDKAMKFFTTFKVSRSGNFSKDAAEDEHGEAAQQSPLSHDESSGPDVLPHPDA